MTNEERKELERRISVMQAYLDGKKIESSRRLYVDFLPAENPVWNWEFYNYRIAEPVKKIKLEAWLDNETGSLGHYVEDCSGVEAPRFTRLPDLDIETEVTE